MSQLVDKDDELQFMAPQTKMPDDWHQQLVKAKVEHDRNGKVCQRIILPLSWLNDFKDKVLVQSDKKLNMIYDQKCNIIYGAYVGFGTGDKIIAMSEIWLKDQ